MGYGFDEIVIFAKVKFNGETDRNSYNYDFTNLKNTNAIQVFCSDDIKFDFAIHYQNGESKASYFDVINKKKMQFYGGSAQKSNVFVKNLTSNTVCLDEDSVFEIVIKAIDSGEV